MSIKTKGDVRQLLLGYGLDPESHIFEKVMERYPDTVGVFGAKIQPALGLTAPKFGVKDVLHPTTSFESFSEDEDFQTLIHMINRGGKPALGRR